MRIGNLILVGLYCVSQIKSDEPYDVVTKEGSSRVDDEKKSSGRDKEYLFPPPLVSPYGGTLKLLMGIAVPISLTGGRILSLGQNFQFQFPIPQNATFFTNYFDDSVGRMMRRWKRTTTNTTLLRRPRNIETRPDKTRLILYRSLELAIERWGGNGRDCMMRSICEAAETPLKDQGLVGQLLDLVLTPDYGNGLRFSSDYDDYLRASVVGKSGYDCTLIYPDCPEGCGLLDGFSKLSHA